MLACAMAISIWAGLISVATTDAKCLANKVLPWPEPHPTSRGKERPFFLTKQRTRQQVDETCRHTNVCVYSVYVLPWIALCTGVHDAMWSSHTDPDPDWSYLLLHKVDHLLYEMIRGRDPEPQVRLRMLIALKQTVSHCFISSFTTRHKRCLTLFLVCLDSEHIEEL